MDESWHGSDILLLRDTHIPGVCLGIRCLREVAVLGWRNVRDGRHRRGSIMAT